uniref:C6 domain-containing protein n=1 Tax=Panagrolaimus superbus TaxID=310955 RepID=A0A914Z7Z4_9BILA
MRPGCHQVSSQLCFCSHPNNYGGTTLEAPLATFTTALPNSTTTLTSTTTTTTTVAPTVLCQTCAIADVALIQGTLPGENPNAPAGIQVVNGCNQLTVICATGDPNIDAVMEVSFIKY